MIKKGIMAAALLGCVTFFTGCSVKETWDILWGQSSESAEDENGAAQEVYDPDAVQVDDSVEAPEFTKNLKGSVTYAVGDKAKRLKVEAETSGKGEITYQWYMNTVSSNGGGMKIDGATENTYTPDTSEEGYSYYFVVATNTVDNAINLSTSELKEVYVDPDATPAADEGEYAQGWNQNEKGWFYVNKNGNYIKNKWKEIDGKYYYFNNRGYILTGWQELEGNWYYFAEDGAMSTGFVDVDGKKYFMNDKGIMNTGWLDGDGSWFYSEEDGSFAVSEWMNIDDAWYYFNEDGVMVTNDSVDGKWLNPDGKLAE